MAGRRSTDVPAPPEYVLPRWETLPIFLMGATNSGKTTIIRALEKDHRFGTVMVGKMLREKYGESYFDGQAAPEKTELEAVGMLAEGIGIARRDGKPYVIVDGQPRSLYQARLINSLVGTRALYVHLWVPREVRETRARQRDAGHPDRLKLSLERLDGDIGPLFEVLNYLSSRGIPITTIDNDRDWYTDGGAADLFMRLAAPLENVVRPVKA